MKLTPFALALLASGGCVRPAERQVREVAVRAFNCADYALSVVEVGPDLFRVTGCGQELIYTCRPATREEAGERQASPDVDRPKGTDDFADRGSDPGVICASASK